MAAFCSFLSAIPWQVHATEDYRSLLLQLFPSTQCCQQSVITHYNLYFRHLSDQPNTDQAITWKAMECPAECISLRLLEVNICMSRSDLETHPDCNHGSVSLSHDPASSGSHSRMYCYYFKQIYIKDPLVFHTSDRNSISLTNVSCICHLDMASGLSSYGENTKCMKGSSMLKSTTLLSPKPGP